MSLKKGKLDVQRYIARCFDGKCEIEMEYIGKCLRMASVDPQSGHIRHEIVLQLEDVYKFLSQNHTGLTEVSNFFDSGVYRHRFSDDGFLIQFAAVGLRAALMLVPINEDLSAMGIITESTEWAGLIKDWAQNGGVA